MAIRELLGLPGGLAGKESCNAGDPGSIPGSGSFPGEGIGNLLQYSWRIPMDRGAWRAAGHGVTKSRTQLSAAQRTLNSTPSQTVPSSGSVSGKRTPHCSNQECKGIVDSLHFTGPRKMKG